MNAQPSLQRDLDLREQNARLKAGLEAATLDIQNLQADVLAKNREIKRLKTELDKMERKHVAQGEVETVFDHFLAVLWSGKGRRPKLDGARQKLIRDRLRDGFTVGELRAALGGLARFPNVGDGGRCGPERGKRYADLKHALRDAETVERFIGYIETAEEPSNVVPLRQREPRVTARTGLELADHLEFACGLTVKDRGNGKWIAQCPAHEDRDPSLTISELNDGKVVMFCWAGCETKAVLDAIGWEFGHLMGRAS